MSKVEQLENESSRCIKLNVTAIDTLSLHNEKSMGIFGSIGGVNLNITPPLLPTTATRGIEHLSRCEQRRVEINPFNGKGGGWADGGVRPQQTRLFIGPYGMRFATRQSAIQRHPLREVQGPLVSRDAGTPTFPDQEPSTSEHNQSHA